MKARIDLTVASGLSVSSSFIIAIAFASSLRYDFH